MKALTFAVPGELTIPTGGYAYDRRIVQELGALGWHVDVVNLGAHFPHPSAEQRAAAAARLLAIPEGRPVVVDGLAYGVLPDAADALCRTHPVIALVHHPLAVESGLFDADASRLRTSERAALACARLVIVTSAATAQLLITDYGVAADRITIALPGTDAAAPAKGSSDGIVRLLAVGAVVPRKGYDVLIAALASISELPWTLTIAGDRTRDPVCAARLDAAIAHHGLGGRVAVLGAVSDERLAELYDSADLFVLPSRFEGYGMAFAEALAHGLPVIGTTAGAIPDTVPQGAGVLVPPDDAQALAAALKRLIDNPAERRSMAARAREACAAQPNWSASAKLFAQAIEAAL
jgi:glycosyltransferase involved in cell wall biosynthesis